MLSSFQLRGQHVGELSAIAQELTFLQANMIKEQKRLEEVIRSKDDVLSRQKEELEDLKEQNKKLQMLTKAKLMLRDDEDKDMDTPSSEDSSPKASFSKGPKAEIKPRSKAAEAKSGAGGGIKTSAPVATLIAAETEQIRHDMRSMMNTVAGPPVATPPPKSRADPAAPVAAAQRPARAAPIGACSPSSDGGNKPPVPSRAAVNKKLQQQQQHRPQSPPPPPIPARSQAPKGTKSPKEERIDSGRESDDFAAAAAASVNDSSYDESKMKKTFKEFLQDNMSSYASSAAAGGPSFLQRSPPSASVLSAGSNGDEGFSSSHEDQNSLSTPPPPPPPPPPRTTSASAPQSSSSPEGDAQKGRQLTNHHRAVQKPRDIKYRSKLKSNSTSTLGVLEEHQVVSSVGGSSGCAGADGAAVTTVTYWTEPYL